MPLSSLGSRLEERCEKAAVRSAAVCAEPGVEEAAAGGCGLRSPVRLSSGTGVMDAEVTSLVLTCGFKWFLLQRLGKEESECQNSSA